MERNESWKMANHRCTSDTAHATNVVVPIQAEWRNNVRLVTCVDDVIKPCPRCKHHFGEHTFDGRCLACMRESKTINDPGRECNVNMHDAWPDLVPAIA